MLCRALLPAARVVLMVGVLSAGGAQAETGPQAPRPPLDLVPCALPGVAHRAQCGKLVRPLDPARPQGRQIEVHFAVLPALARQSKPDPVFFLAGGPGQSALQLAGSAAALLSRLANRRDIVLIDQRGTGRSAALECEAEEPLLPLAEQLDAARQRERLARCRSRLQALPHGDLRFYDTTIAMQDADAVRRALGAEKVNLVGASYGTRAALEWMRLFPGTVRRALLDGVVPPDTALPAGASGDAQAALDGVFASCAADPGCAARHPVLQQQWRALLATLPREVDLRHPLSGEVERVRLDRAALLGLVRSPLYLPSTASALPFAIGEAARGRFDALVGLSATLQSRRASAVAVGMHFSVICSEDGSRLSGDGEKAGADFSDPALALYRDVCAAWPRGDVPAAFYTVGPAPAATLLLSGGLDPVTPPSNGDRVARALGARARHVVVPNAGHGVLSLPCLRDVLFRFIDADGDADALAVDAGCAAGVPRPAAFVPPGRNGARP